MRRPVDDAAQAWLHLPAPTSARRNAAQTGLVLGGGLDEGQDLLLALQRGSQGHDQGILRKRLPVEDQVQHLRPCRGVIQAQPDDTGRVQHEATVKGLSIGLGGSRRRDGRYFIGAGAFHTVIGADRKIVEGIRIKVCDRG